MYEISAEDLVEFKVHCFMKRCWRLGIVRESLATTGSCKTHVHGSLP